MRLAWLVAFALAALPAAASARIYKWVDQDGRTVFSNRPPANARLAAQAQVVVDDDPTAEAGEDQARRERELQERVSRLERELAAQQYAAPAYYAPPPPPPPAQYAAEPYYPPEMGYPIGGYPIASTILVLPARRPVRRFAPRPFAGSPHRFAAFHHGGMHHR